MVCSAYADSIQSGIQARLGVLFDVCFIEKNSISQTLEKALRLGYRYSIIAGGQNERKNTLNLNVLRTVGEERMSHSCARACLLLFFLLLHLGLSCFSSRLRRRRVTRGHFIERGD